MIETEYMLNLWLTVVPDDTVIFTRLILCTTIIDSMANPLMVAVTATGHIRRYHIIVGGCLLSIIPLSYGVLKLGCSPASVLVVHFLLSVVAFAIRLCIVTRMINMPLYIYIKEVILKVSKLSYCQFLCHWSSVLSPYLFYCNRCGMRGKCFCHILCVRT